MAQALQRFAGPEERRVLPKAAELRASKTEWIGGRSSISAVKEAKWRRNAPTKNLAQDRFRQFDAAKQTLHTATRDQLKRILMGSDALFLGFGTFSPGRHF